MSKRSHRKCLPSPRSLGGPRTETTFQKWSASLKRLRTAALKVSTLTNLNTRLVGAQGRGREGEREREKGRQKEGRLTAE